jgi:hypothetical protein
LIPKLFPKDKQDHLFFCLLLLARGHHSNALRNKLRGKGGGLKQHFVNFVPLYIQSSSASSFSCFNLMLDPLVRFIG